MTRPRRVSFKGERRSRAKRPTSQTRRGEYLNPTTNGGTIVHAFAEGRWPTRCGWRITVTVYTSEPVNCVKCREADEDE